jgi:predicted permease
MSEFAVIARAVVPLFVIIAMGGFLRRFGRLPIELDKPLVWLCINVFAPALIFESVVGNEKLRHWDNLLLPPTVGFAATTAGIGIGWLASKWSGAVGSSQRRTFAVVAGVQNYFYYATPLIVLLFDPATLGVLFIHNLGVEAALWTVAVAVLTGNSISGMWRCLWSGPIIALLGATTLNLAQVHSLWLQTLLNPAGVMIRTAVMLGQCAVPVALLLTGAIYANHLHELHRGASVRLVTSALLIRFGIVPVMYLAIAYFLPCSIELKHVLLVQGTMPSAMFLVPMTRQFGGDSRVALQGVFATNIAALIMVPIWLRIDALFVR